MIALAHDYTQSSYHINLVTALFLVHHLLGSYLFWLITFSVSQLETKLAWQPITPYTKCTLSLDLLGLTLIILRTHLFRVQKILLTYHIEVGVIIT